MVVGGHMPVGIQERWKGDPQSSTVRTYCFDFVLLVLAHRQDCKSCCFMSIVHCLERTHLLPAGSAPRGPKVDDHWTTPVVAQGHRDAIRIVGDKIRGWLSRRQKTLGLLCPCRLGWVSPQP